MKRIVLIAMVVLISAPNVLAQSFCNGDHDYDGDCDSDDVTTFLADFGRSQYNNPCPPDGPVTIPKTGCVYSTALADDGEKQCGASVVVRFTDNNDGTVRDNLTGLIWLKNWIDTGVTWIEAVNGCSNLSNSEQGLSDFSDNGEWRLPNINEWLSLADFECSGGLGTQCLPQPHPFEFGAPLQPLTYWTSTNTNTSLYSYTFSFDNGGPEYFIQMHYQLLTHLYACVKCGCRESPESGHTMNAPCCNSSECQTEPGCCCRYFSNGQWYRKCTTPDYCSTQVDSGSCVNPDVIYW